MIIKTEFLPLSYELTELIKKKILILILYLSISAL